MGRVTHQWHWHVEDVARRLGSVVCRQGRMPSVGAKEDVRSVEGKGFCEDGGANSYNRFTQFTLQCAGWIHHSMFAGG